MMSSRVFRSLRLNSNNVEKRSDLVPVSSMWLYLMIILILFTTFTTFTTTRISGVSGLRCRLDEGPSDAELKRVTRNCMKKFGESYYNMGIMNLDMMEQQQPRVRSQSDFNRQSMQHGQSMGGGGGREGRGQRQQQQNVDRKDRHQQRPGGHQMNDYYDDDIQNGNDDNYYDMRDTSRNQGRHQQGRTQYYGNGQRNGQRNADHTDTISYNGHYSNYYNPNSNNNNNHDHQNRNPNHNYNNNNNNRNYNEDNEEEDRYRRRNQQQNYSHGNRGNRNAEQNHNNNSNNRNYNNNNNNNNNNDNSNNNKTSSNNNNNEEDAAGVCIVHCFFEQLHMLNGLDYPDRHKVMYILTRDIRDRELRNFYVDTIQECFRYLELQRRPDKCQFSRDLINCMNEYAKGYCDDWDTFNLMFN